LRELVNKKVLFCKLFVRYLVVKPACVNAALANIIYTDDKTSSEAWLPGLFRKKMKSLFKVFYVENFFAAISAVGAGDAAAHP